MHGIEYLAEHVERPDVLRGEFKDEKAACDVVY